MSREFTIEPQADPGAGFSIRPMLESECSGVAEMITALMVFHSDRHAATAASVARYCSGEMAGCVMTYDWPNLTLRSGA